MNINIFKNGWKKKPAEKIQKKKKLFIALALILAVIGFFNFFSLKKSSSSAETSVQTMAVGRNFEFPGISSQGKVVSDRIKFKITNAEKTNKVMVQDKTFTARNKKLFLIVNLELTNESTQPLNLLPGDLIRLTIGDNKETKYAPDLHNNLVPVAAISTRVDRVGFVIAENEKNFTLSVGEIDGKKEEVGVGFPS